jgi:hypothetical protein
VSTSNGAVQNLTSDRARLLRAINQSDLSADISDEAKEIEASVFALTGRTWSTLNDGRCQCGLCVLETITRVADAVQSSARRRKVLFFVGSDLLLQTADPAGSPSNDVGFRPADTSANGNFHQITVKTTRRGLDVRARSGYLAASAAVVAASATASGPVSEPVRDALTGLLPASSAAVDFNAATFAIPGTRKAAVVLTVGVNAFTSQTSAESGSTRGSPLEIVATAFDPGGRQKGAARRCDAHCQRLRLCNGSRFRCRAVIAVEHPHCRDAGNADCAQGFSCTATTHRADGASRVRTE